MSNRVLRGSGLGGVSFEDDRGVEFAPRQTVSYDCARGHRVEITMADDAEVPAVWECPHCGGEALRSTGERPEPKQEKPARTHWDMLRERRTISELEELLAERVQLLRSGEIGPAHLHRPRAAGSKRSA
ncbi:MAG TPA: RNA polymerase-binding protein RbpA [Kribbellaceae bacterium]|nr:RNA polymerase-binding protein RbpA [Kribbellaceae bacterium]